MNEVKYKVAEVMVFNTCNYRCGYCGFAVNGSVQDNHDMEPFKNHEYIDQIVNFFKDLSDSEHKWVLHLSGGEPLLMPNADYFSSQLIASGHQLAFNTNLSLPIEKNGWMDNNPTEAVDCIITSLHQQSLDRFETIFNRVRCLKEAGYPICVRMVAHPKFIQHFELFHQRFKEIDVSFSVNPMYSPHYPKCYTEKEKRKIIQFMKVNYEAIRLNGGLDMTGRTCRAGSGMLCVALGQSGGGKVYPCVSVSTPDHCMGDIFSGVELFKKETPCLRKDKVCSCAIHFLHDVIPTANDHETHKKMVTGFKESIVSTFEDWFKKNQIQTKFHDSTPQGTQKGETLLVLDKTHFKQFKEPKNKRVKYTKLDSPLFRQWTQEHSILVENEVNDRHISLTSRPCQYSYLATSPPFKLSTGSYELAYTVELQEGGVSLGIMNEGKTCWLFSSNHAASGPGVISFDLLKKDQNVCIVLAACNLIEEAKVCATLHSLTLKRCGGLFTPYSNRLRQYRSELVELWRVKYKPAFYKMKIRAMTAQGRTNQKLRRAVPNLPWEKHYRTIDWADAGYAVRSIIQYKGNDGQDRILTADVGHNSVSSLPVIDGRMGPRQKIRFPEGSAPMYLSSVRRDDGVSVPLTCFFNFDRIGQSMPYSCVALLNDFEALEKKEGVNNVADHWPTLFKRPGHWGYRGVHVLQDKDFNYAIAAVDRDKGLFHLLSGKPLNGQFHHREEVVDIGVETEPIGLNAIRTNKMDSLQANYYMSSRNQNEIIVVGFSDDGDLHVKQRCSIKGRSRSSVAVGRFRSAREYEVAVGLWGGDPTDLNAFGIGEIVVARTAEDGTLSDLDYVEAGVHPTDIAAGDLDGDGLDELAVLNYGVGLGPADRRHPGSVQIFKHLDGAFRCVSEIKVPNPRIACVTDIDGDGIGELLVSLFFENTLVTIKFL